MQASELFDVSGEIVMVTGGGTGIGRSIARVLVENGARVALVGRREVELVEAAEALAGMKGRVVTVVADLRRDADIAAAFAAAEAAFGPVTVLVNNAAIAHRDKATEIERGTISNLFSVNVEALLLCAQEAARRMIAEKIEGSIVNISSVLSQIPMRQVVAYGASKAAVSQMTRTLALEWSKHRIRVNEIRPGWFETELTEPFLKGHGAGIMAQQNPLHRLGRLQPPGDLDGAILLLASRASAYMTGSAITVDGGHSLGR